jgi:hypothetical protein
MEYPPITRHSWNTPPSKINGFYIKEMGVLADASLIFPNKSKFANFDDRDNGILLEKVSEHKYKWNQNLPIPIPYYTNIEGEFNELWNGREENRGVLEMPLTIDDFTAYGFAESDKEIISALPNGGLVSTYLHPKGNLKLTKKLITYLRNNYNLVFISAIDYLKLYMSYYPRPVLYDQKTQKNYWAYLGSNEVTPITETENVVYNKETNSLDINLHNPPPYIAIRGNKEIILDKCYLHIKTLNYDTEIYQYCNQREF